MEIEGSTFVMMSVYIPTVSEGRAAMEERLKAIEEAMARQRMVNPAVEFIVGGDFNRHDALWGGNQVADTARQGEGERIIQLMLENDLQSLLPQGTITWESRGLKATINLSLSTSRLAEERIRCMIWPNHYGSDHSHIHTTYSIKRPEPVKANRLLFKEADWDKIRGHISALKRSNPCPTNLDMAAQWLQDTISNTIIEYCQGLSRHPTPRGGGIVNLHPRGGLTQQQGIEQASSTVRGGLATWLRRSQQRRELFFIVRLRGPRETTGTASLRSLLTGGKLLNA